MAFIYYIKFSQKLFWKFAQNMAKMLLWPAKNCKKNYSCDMGYYKHMRFDAIWVGDEIQINAIL